MAKNTGNDYRRIYLQNPQENCSLQTLSKDDDLELNSVGLNLTMIDI